MIIILNGSVPLIVSVLAAVANEVETAWLENKLPGNRHNRGHIYIYIYTYTD